MMWGLINVGVAGLGLLATWWYRRKSTTSPATSSDPLDIEGVLRIIADLMGRLQLDPSIKAELADHVMDGLRAAGLAQVGRRLSPAGLMTKAAVETAALKESLAAKS